MHRDELLKRLVELQNVANALPAGADRNRVQTATANVIRAAADSNACGPLRVGVELPQPT